MIGIVATLKAQDGKGAELEAVFTALAAEVRSKEKGNLAYALTKSRSEANTYKVLELYADDDAVKAHRAAEHFIAAGPKIGACLDGKAQIEILDGV